MHAYYINRKSQRNEFLIILKASIFTDNKIIQFKCGFAYNSEMSVRAM